MSVRTISQLRQRMIDDMTARQLGPQTQRHYICGCKRFAAFLGRSASATTACFSASLHCRRASATTEYRREKCHQT